MIALWKFAKTRLKSILKKAEPTMAQITSVRNVEVRSQDKEVVIKLEITLNMNLSTGQFTVGASAEPVPATNKINQEMKLPEFFIPKFDETTELIEGFGQ